MHGQRHSAHTYRERGSTIHTNASRIGSGLRERAKTSSTHTGQRKPTIYYPTFAWRATMYFFKYLVPCLSCARNEWQRMAEGEKGEEWKRDCDSMMRVQKTLCCVYVWRQEKNRQKSVTSERVQRALSIGIMSSSLSLSLNDLMLSHSNNEHFKTETMRISILVAFRSWFVCACVCVCAGQNQVRMNRNAKNTFFVLCVRSFRFGSFQCWSLPFQAEWIGRSKTYIRSCLTHWNLCSMKKRIVDCQTIC